MTMAENLSARLASLQRKGCNEKVAWSRNGAIAYLSDSTVKITHIISTDGLSWDLAPSTAIPNISVIHRDSPIIHVAWGPIGGDIACIDSQGELSIFSTGVAGAMSCVFHPSSSVETQQPSELNGVVGFKWLDLDKSVLLASPAIRISPQQQQQQKGGPSYHASYGVSQGKPAGPYHPLPGKQACIGVTRRGVVRLTTQGKTDARYYQVSVNLDGNRQDHCISHATWKGCKDNSLLLVTYSSQLHIIRAYRILIKWNLTIQKPGQTGANGSNVATNGSPPLDNNNNELANLSVERILSTSLTPPQETNGLALTHLEAIPNTPHKQSTMSDGSGNEIYLVYGSSSKSVVYKYSLMSKHIPLHPSFYSLGNRRDSSQDEMETKLVLQDTSNFSKSPIVSLNFGSHDTFEVTCFANGDLNLTYRGLHQNQTNQDQKKPSTYISLYDAGYKFPSIPLSNACLSPNQASYAFLNERDELKVNYAERPIQPDNNEEALLSSAIALAVRHSISCFSNVASDDMFCVISKELASIKKHNPRIYDRFLRILLQESHRAVNFTLDLPKDYQIDKVMVNPSLQRLLSMQLTLGTIDKNWQRNPMSKVAWSVLNIRLLAFALTFTLRASSQPKIQVPAGTTEMEVKANHVQTMLGLIRWCTDLLAFICQELYLLSLDKQTPQTPDQESKTSIATTIMFASVPRMLLIYSLRGIRGLETMTSSFASQENNPLNGVAASTYQRLKETMSMAPVPLPLFEKMLTDIDGAIKRLHPTLQDRLSVEQKLMFDAKLPKELKPIKDRVIEVFRTSLLPEIDVSNLYFYDVSWLGLSEDDGNDNDNVFWEHEEKDHEIDVLRKLIISSSAEKRRRCVRCGGVSVWDDLKTLMYTQWTVAFQKNCLCGGNWYSI